MGFVSALLQSIFGRGFVVLQTRARQIGARSEKRVIVRVLKKLWRGEYSLWIAFFVFYCSGIIALGLVNTAVIYAMTAVVWPPNYMVMKLADSLGWGLVVYALFAGVGTVRSAARGYGPTVGFLRGAFMVGACLYAGLEIAKYLPKALMAVAAALGVN